MEPINCSPNLNRILFLFFFIIGFYCVNNKIVANTIEDTKYGLKIDNLNSDWIFSLANNDSIFKRISISSKENNISFILYAYRGQLKHDVTDKYDSILLKENYKKPYASKIIEEFGLKGFRNSYKYQFLNKNKHKIDEYITFDILYKKYNKDEEYFYLIYSYSIIENDPRESYLRSLLSIQPPIVSFWETNIGTIVFYLIYLIIGLGLLFYGKLVFRKSYYSIKNSKIVLAGIKNKSEIYREIENSIFERTPNADSAKLPEFISGTYSQIILKELKKSKFILTLSLFALLIINLFIINYFFDYLSILNLSIHVGTEIALILIGSFLNLNVVFELLLEALG